MARAPSDHFLEWPPDEAPEAIGRQVAAAVALELLGATPPSSEREAVRLFHVDGRLTPRQIALELGCAPAAVTDSLERFRSRLKRVLVLRLFGIFGSHAQPADEGGQHCGAVVDPMEHPALDPATDDALAALSRPPDPDPERAAKLFARARKSVV